MIKNHIPVSFFFASVITILIFWQFFLKGLYPFPGNYLLAWYEPWKTDYTVGETIKIPHKPVADDTFRYLYPLKVLSMESFRKLELPLWNPYNGSGMPLFATIQSGFLNPLNIVFFFFENRLAWTLYIILQALLLSFFTYLYCKKIKLSIAASLFTSVTFLLSGFVIARLIFGNIIYPLTLLPATLYLIEDFLQNPNTRKIFFLPIAIALLFFVGHPQILFYVFAFSILYFLYRFFITQKGKKNKSLFVSFFIFLLIGIGLAGVQIIPTLELFRNANINPESSRFIFERFLLPPYHLISVLIPNYFGNRATYNYWGAGDYIETVASIGIIPCFFAYIAFLKGHNLKKDMRLFFFISMLISILSTLNWFLPKLFFSLPIPVIATSLPSRIFVLTTFSLAVLAGYGFDRWRTDKKISKKIFSHTLPFIAGVLVLLLGTFLFLKMGISCNNQFITNCAMIALRNTLLEIFIFTIAIGFFFIYLFFKNKIVRCIPFLIIFLVLTLGIYNSNKFLPFSKKETILPTHPLVKVLKDKTQPDRVFGFGEANIKTNFATNFRFFDPNYLDPLFNKRYAELIGYANTKNFPPPLKRSDIEITKDLVIDKSSDLSRKRLLNLLGVKYLIVKKEEAKNIDAEKTFWEDANWAVKTNLDSLPRAYIVSNFEILTDQKLILERLFDKTFDYRKRVILEEKPGLQLKDSELSNEKVSIKQYRENIVSITTSTTANGLLVLSDNYYPGWKAYVDGKQTQIYRANYTFRSIFLPKGRHSIIFEYQPQSLKTGIIISLVSLTILAIIYFARNKYIFKNG